MTSPWRSIIALNLVSTLAQIGQFGIGFIVLPLWLTDQGLNAQTVGFFAASQWAGMLLALHFSPQFIEKYGSKNTVLISLLCGIVAFGLFFVVGWPQIVLPAFLLGIGMGLRWIANETWLFQMIPAGLKGKMVGLHETLIATAGIVAPIVPIWLGIAGHNVLWVGLVFSSAALVPLLITPDHRVNPMGNDFEPQSGRSTMGAVMVLAVVASVIGGFGDGALYGLFSIFAAGIPLDTEHISILLLAMGIGGIVFQLPVGSIVDSWGLQRTVLLCALTGVLASVALLAGQSIWWFSVLCAFVLGGANTALLTLGVYASTINPARVSQNMRLVSIAFTSGSIAGPLVAGVMMSVVSRQWLMWQMILVCAVLTLYVGSRRRKTVSLTQQ